MAQKKVVIVIGHGGHDCGAVNHRSGMSELKYNSEIAQLLSSKLAKYQSYVYNRGFRKMEDMDYINSLNADAVISLHANASNGKSTGSEVLYWNGRNDSQLLAARMLGACIAAFKLTNRGLKPKNHGDRGAGFLSRNKAPACLLEPFFIDNDNDLSVAMANKEKYASAIAQAMDMYLASK